MYVCFFPSTVWVKGIKGPHVAFLLLFYFVYHVLRDSKESKMRDHGPPIPNIVCDPVIAESLAFLKSDWVYVESCQWPLGIPLFSYTHSTCMNKLYFTKKASACSWLKISHVIDCALNSTDCLKQMFVHELLASVL